MVTFAEQEALADRLERIVRPGVRRGFRDSLVAVRARIPARDLRDTFAAGDDAGVLALIGEADRAVDWRPFRAGLNQAVIRAGVAHATLISDAVERAVSKASWGFDPFRESVARPIKRWIDGLVDYLIGVGRVAAALALRETRRWGPARPVEPLLGSLGLNEQQVRAAAALRLRLSEPPRRGPRLTEAQIRARVLRYQEQALASRGLVIGRNEARRAVALATWAAWRQAAEDGIIDPRTTTKRWVNRDDDKVRGAHRRIPELNPDGVPLLAPFTSPLGMINHPHDPDAPAGNVIGCRCTLNVILPKQRRS